MSEKSAAVIKSALSAYDFSPFESVYDIGGGHGQFMRALLKNYPNLHGMIFERPEVIAGIRKNTPFLENDNCALVHGDFFKSIPKGGNVYILKSVLHDWDVKKCGEILENCHQAMDSNSRLLIVEIVLQPKQESVYAKGSSENN